MSTQNTNDLFITASRKKFRFQTSKGTIGTEDLWELSLKSLDELAVGLDEKVQQSGRKSFVTSRSVTDTETTTKFEIVKFVIDTKLAEAETAKTRAEKASQREFLKGLLVKKQTEKLEGLSAEEIQKQLDQLGE